MTSKAEKVISASVSRFTPCPDTLVEQYSHTTALVWGKVWRYSQMADGVCRASILRLADDLSLVPNTISKHLSLLEEGKYIVDKTPNLRNKPHIYADTGKLQLRVSITMDEPEAGTQNLSSHYSNFEVEESTTKGREAQSIFTAYEANIGALTPMIAEEHWSSNPNDRREAQRGRTGVLSCLGCRGNSACSFEQQAQLAILRNDFEALAGLGQGRGQGETSADPCRCSPGGTQKTRI